MARLPVIFCFLMLSLSTANAQETGSRYVVIPFQGNFEAQFKERLASTNAAPLQKLLHQIFPNSKKFNLDSTWLNELLNNPALLNKLKQEDPDLEKKLQGLLKNNVNEVTNRVAMNEVKKAFDKIKQPLNNLPQDHFAKQNVHPGQLAQPAKPKPDVMAQWLEDMLREADQSRLGDWLRDSPSFQQGLADLKDLVDTGNISSNWGLDHLPDWDLPNQFNLNLGEGFLSGLDNISLPDLPKIDLPRIEFGGWNAPGMSLPNIGAPRGMAGAEMLLWIGIVVISLVLLWRLAKKIGLDRPNLSRRNDLGPWPVDPANIVTRAQLVKAFDYLAVLRLGVEVRPWNHRAIAGQMSATTNEGCAVDELTGLYELARYTEGADTLTEPQQMLARRHVTLLARVPGS
jgi:hypothetical protein